MGENRQAGAGKRAGDEEERRPPTDMRTYRGRIERQVIIGAFVILFIVGGGLAWLLYGAEAFVFSWLCLGVGAALLSVLYLMFRRAG